MGSSGKSNIQGSSGKNNFFMGSTGKKDSPLVSSGKSVNIFASSGKATNLETAKAGSMYGTSSKTTSVFGSTAKSASPYGSDKTTKLLAPIDKSSAAFLAPKNVNAVGINDRSSKPINFGGKNTTSSSRDYPSFVNPKANKPTASFGIIWIPTRKNKKKDLVYNSHNYERYKEKSPSMYSTMSGDSPAFQTHKKKEEETDLLVPERPKVTTVAVNTGITAASIDIASDTSGAANTEEKQEFIKRDSIDSKDAAGDTNERSNKEDCEYLENSENITKTPENKWDNEKQVDKVDSVYLRPPPPHKVRSTASTNEEEDCGIKCLYYTLECCDCVLM